MRQFGSRKPCSCEETALLSDLEMWAAQRFSGMIREQSTVEPEFYEALYTNRSAMWLRHNQIN